MEIQRSGKSYLAVVVKDPSNPAAINKQLMRGLTYDVSHNFWNGEVYAAKRDEYVPVTLRMKGAESLLMTAGTAVLSKDVAWTRAPASAKH